MENVGLSFGEIARVRSSYNNMKLDLMDVLATFYARLHMIEPTFTMTTSPEHEVANRAIISMIKLVLSRLDNLDSLAIWLKPLGVKYQGRGIHDFYYASTGNAMLQTLHYYLGAQFDAKTRVAWLNLYDAIISHMLADLNVTSYEHAIEKHVATSLQHAL
jgi:hemoglobin-like flavoprotein